MTPSIRYQIFSLGLMVAMGSALLFLLAWFGQLPQAEILKPLRELTMVQLQEDPLVEKARKIMDNPLANQFVPQKADILSDQNSTALQKDIPADDLRMGGDQSLTRTAEDESRKDAEEFSGPFRKSRLNENTMMQHLTGEQAATSTEVGHLYELNTYKWEFAPYMLRWKDKMTGKWYEITSRVFFQKTARLGEIIISARVGRDGRLLDSKIVDFNCDRSFVAPAYASVVNSFPLDPLPSNFPDEFLETTWTIRIVP